MMVSGLPVKDDADFREEVLEIAPRERSLGFLSDLAQECARGNAGARVSLHESKVVVLRFVVQLLLSGQAHNQPGDDACAYRYRSAPIEETAARYLQSMARCTTALTLPSILTMMWLQNDATSRRTVTL